MLNEGVLQKNRIALVNVIADISPNLIKFRRYFGSYL